MDVDGAMGAAYSAAATIVLAGQGQEDAAAPPRRQRVSLCMIVKNEEKNLSACLAPVASLFDEIILVDTGSTDQTKASARRFGAKVVEFAWVDSFAAARNE